MRNKGWLFFLLLLLGLLAFSAAFAEQNIQLDSSASITLPDSFKYDRAENGYKYYKDKTNNISLGFRIADGQISLSTVESLLTRSGFSKVKTEKINDVQVCHGARKVDSKRTTVMYYYNTEANHYVLLALTYEPKTASSAKAVKSVVKSIHVQKAVSISLNAGAPFFSWTGVNKKVISASVYGGKDLILIYGTLTERGYTEGFLELISPWVSKLKKCGVQVLVGLYSSTGGTLDDSQISAFAARFPGVICARASDNSLWKSLENVGYTGERVSYPIVFLRSRTNRLKYYSSGIWEHALSVVSGALQMAASDAPAVPPDPEVPPTDEIDTVTEEHGIYKVSGKTAILIGVDDPSVTKLVMLTNVTVNGVACEVTGIADKACKGLKNLTEVIISKYVTAIGKEAFKDCVSLNTIKIGTQKLTEAGIGKNAFKNTGKKPQVLCFGSIINQLKKWLPNKGLSGQAVYRKIK